MNRVGIHVRESIVDQARQQLGQDSELPTPDTGAGQPEPIPEKQEDINKQADAAIRDLFPRIPNTDRQMILEHSFNKVGAPSMLINRRHQFFEWIHILTFSALGTTKR